MEFLGSYVIIRYDNFKINNLPIALPYVYPKKYTTPYDIKCNYNKLFKSDRGIHIKNFYEIEGCECWVENNFNTLTGSWWSPAPAVLDKIIMEKYKRVKGLDVYQGKTTRIIGGINLRIMRLNSIDSNQYQLVKK